MAHERPQPGVENVELREVEERGQEPTASEVRPGLDHAARQAQRTSEATHTKTVEPPGEKPKPEVEYLRDLEADEREEEPTASDAVRLLGAVAAVATIAALVAFVPTGSFFGRLVGSCAVIGGAVQVLDARRWRRKGYLDIDYLRRGLLGIFFAIEIGLLGLALAGFLAPPNHAIILLGPWPWGAAVASHFLTPRIINRLIEKAGPENRPVPRGKLYWWFDPRAKDLILLDADIPCERCSKLGTIGRWGRWILALGLPLVLAILSSTAFGLAVTTGDWLGEPTAAEIAKAKAKVEAKAKAAARATAEAQIRAARDQEAAERKRQQQRAQRSEAPQASSSGHQAPGLSESPLLQPLLPLREEWDGECKKVKQRSRGTAKAARTIERLLDGSELTSKQEGCIGHLIPHIYRPPYRGRERYFTSVNTNQLTGTPLSYAIDSEGLGSLLVLWQMAPAIERLVSKYGSVGGVIGFPDYPAGVGDLYLIKTRVGTFVFIRREPGEPYRKLPPTAARAWLGEMKNAKEFLWPSAGEPGIGTETRFVLRTDKEGTEGEEVATVHWYSSGFAWRGTYQYPFEPVRELNTLELLKYAANA